MPVRETHYFHLSVAIFPVNNLEMKARAEKLAQEKNAEFLHRFNQTELQRLPMSRRSRIFNVISTVIWTWVGVAGGLMLIRWLGWGW